MKSTKKTKSENPFKLGAAVALFRPGSGVERLGQIVKITKCSPAFSMGFGQGSGARAMQSEQAWQSGRRILAI
jgi:hypothetical protein